MSSRIEEVYDALADRKKRTAFEVASIVECLPGDTPYGMMDRMAYFCRTLWKQGRIKSAMIGRLRYYWRETQ